MIEILNCHSLIGAQSPNSTALHDPSVATGSSDSDKTSCVCFPVQTSNYRQRHDRRPLQACDRPLVSDPSDAMHIRSNLSATQTGFLIGRPALVSGHALHRPIARLGARESLPRRPLGRFASPRHVDCSSLMINALFETILHIVYIRPHVGTTSSGDMP